MDRGIQTSRVEVRATAEGERGRWPFVWLTAWFPKRMWPIEAIPCVSSSCTVDLWFPGRKTWPWPVMSERTGPLMLVDSGMQGPRVVSRVCSLGIAGSMPLGWRSGPKGRRRCWPFDADELAVFMTDVVNVGHSTGESTDDARSHLFLLNNRECATVLYLARQLSVFHKLD
jgi:hypothetical protein